MTSITKYIIKVDPKIDEKKAKYFFNRSQEILNSSQRWPGHDFNYVGLQDGYYKETTPLMKEYDVILVLLCRSTKHELLKLSNADLVDQPKVDGKGNLIDFDTVELSYTFYTIPKLIVIDDINWDSANENIGISKAWYEQYVILHEFGHAIGKIHKPIPEDVTKSYPIMYQATLGLPDPKRFKPYPNESDDLDI